MSPSKEMGTLLIVMALVGCWVDLVEARKGPSMLIDHLDRKDPRETYLQQPYPYTCHENKGNQMTRIGCEYDCYHEYEYGKTNPHKGILVCRNFPLCICDPCYCRGIDGKCRTGIMFSCRAPGSDCHELPAVQSCFLNKSIAIGDYPTQRPKYYKIDRDEEEEREEDEED